MPKIPRVSVQQCPDLLSAKQVAQCLSVSARTVYRMVARGTLPQPIRYTRRLVRWRKSDLMSWLEEQTPGKNAG